ncbi:MAG: DNA helicase RecQ [Alphaproteobacteria bacterium]|nr:DNA helicase RecQ [Alphaproteobacteria bacterium]
MRSAPARRDIKHDVLKAVFGFEGFRPGQEAAIDAVLSGQNVLAVMPTGSGKSLCFQVPALMTGGLTIVVSPLVALMQDQVAALRLAGVAADTINSAKPRDENVAVWRRVAAGETRLLYLSPERLMTEPMLAALARLKVSLIAVDEAHCISQWGPAFRPEYEALARLADTFPRVPIIALTATADEATRADIAARLFGGKVEQIVLGFDRPNIRMTAEAKNGGKQQVLDFVRAHRGQSGIVYCLSRKKTEAMAALLNENDITALAYHAGMSKEERETNQNRFMTEPSLVMAATIAFGMGIDKSDVRFVLHADMPGSLEAYYQEIGRAGRDGANARAHMLYGQGDIRMRRMFIDDEDAGEERRKREHKRLAALVSYCETQNCRRQILLSYFGELSAPCGNCDNCLSPAGLSDGTKDAALVLQVVARTGERYGAAHIVDILRGANTEKVTAAGHASLHQFAEGRARKKEVWSSLIRQLVAGEFLHHDIDGFGGLSLLDKGRALLDGKQSFHHRPHMAQTPARRGRDDNASANMSGEQAQLLAELKKLRFSIAAARKVPAYLIFSDRSLIDMVRLLPRNADEFALVNGVGTSKLEAFGQQFIAAISKFHASRS